MAKAYVLQEKMYTQTDADGFESLSSALRELKKIIQEHCSIDSELKAIAKKGLPAPKYRASVYKYLKTFFKTDKFPSHTIIDYSDYEETPREFEDYYLDENEVEFDDISMYEYELGFAFWAGKKGMRLYFPGRRLMTSCCFIKCDDKAFFSIEYMSSGRTGLDARIFKSETDLPPKLSGSFYNVMILDALLNSRYPSSEKVLSENIESILCAKMNEGFILPSKLTFSQSTIKEYIEILKKFGYTVNKVENGYYIPPFICKKDADIIIECIKENGGSGFSKAFQAEKFKEQSGYYRFSENDIEESDVPVPHHSEWSAGYYSLIIYNLLRLCARPLLKTSFKKDSIQGLAKKYYGVEIDRKKAIPNNTEAMIAMDLSIEKIDGKYCFDKSKLILEEDMNYIEKCIMKSNIIEGEKTRLVQKLKDKFTINKY